ncbi:phage major capsid protein, partial [Parasphingorhabdus sp.]
MNLVELQEKRGRLVANAREALEEIGKNTDESRTAELEARHDTIMAEFDTVDANIKRAERMASIEATAQEAEERARQANRPNSDGEASAAASAEGPSYREAFHSYIRNAGQMGALSGEERQVLSAGFEQIEARAQTTTAAAGGYTVPTEMMPELTRSMLAFGPMYDPGVTREIVTSGGGAMTLPTVNDTAVTAEAHTEGQTLIDDGGKDAVFGEKTLDAFAFNTEWLRVSKELADDSPFAFEALLGSLLGERLGRIANAQLTTGSGSSAPNGIVTASSLGDTAAATTAVTFDEVLDFTHSVDPAYRAGPGVGYMFNDSTLLALRKLKDGDGNYLWQAGNVQGGIAPTLNGYSYSINQAMASLSDGAASKVMLFGDLQKYIVRKVGAPLIGAISDKDFW